LPISSKPSLGIYALISVILFWVNVPVLSEQMILVLPKVSTAGNFLTIAFLWAILPTPIDKTIVTITGSPSGMAETAKDTEVIKISIIGIPYHRPIAKITIQIAIAIIPSFLPSSANFS